MKTGLVLEGGAMRGIYTAGVLDVFLEYGIQVDGVMGVSAGAIHGVSYVSGQHGRSLRYNMQYCRDPRYMSLRSLLKTGDLFGVDFCYHELPERLDPFDNDAFELSSTEYYLTCTDIETGQPCYQRCESIRGEEIDWVRASASMPLASRVVTIGKHKLLDGGIADPIPVDAFRRLGFARNLVILTRPEGYQKKHSSAMPLIRRAFRGYPALIDAMDHRHEVYNTQLARIDELLREGDTFLIRPSRYLKISRTERNPRRIQAMYDLGRQDALRTLPDVLEFLGHTGRESSINREKCGKCI